LGTQDQVTNFEVTVALRDYNAKFRPGMSTTVDIITETRNDVIKVPIQAVTVREKEKLEKEPDIEEDNSEASESSSDSDPSEKHEVVFCVEENKAVAKPVVLGISDDTHYEVISGLEEGDLVVTGPFRVLSKTLKNDDLLEYEEPKEEEKNVN
jgi:HlyD family secretion protein